MHYYTVTLPDDRTLMHVRAKGKNAARICALAGIEVKRLSTDDVIDLHQRGIAIVDAETGKVCNNGQDKDAPE